MSTSVTARRGAVAEPLRQGSSARPTPAATPSPRRWGCEPQGSGPRRHDPPGRPPEEPLSWPPWAHALSLALLLSGLRPVAEKEDRPEQDRSERACPVGPGRRTPAEAGDTAALVEARGSMLRRPGGSRQAALRAEQASEAYNGARWRLDEATRARRRHAPTYAGPASAGPGSGDALGARGRVVPGRRRRRRPSTRCSAPRARGPDDQMLAYQGASSSLEADSSSSPPPRRWPRSSARRREAGRAGRRSRREAAGRADPPSPPPQPPRRRRLHRGPQGGPGPSAGRGSGHLRRARAGTAGRVGGDRERAQSSAARRRAAAAAEAAGAGRRRGAGPREQAGDGQDDGPAVAAEPERTEHARHRRRRARRPPHRAAGRRRRSASRRRSSGSPTCGAPPDPTPGTAPA